MLKRNVLSVIGAALLLALWGCGGNSSSHEQGVVINGVTWATCNVGAPGSFVRNPEDAGMFYQWNRKLGWSTADPIIASDGSTTWEEVSSEATTWETTNDPSPKSWHVPTKAELETLFDTEKVTNEKTTQKGVEGRKFTDIATGNSIFLPACGFRGGSTGKLYNYGHKYWSATHSEVIYDISYAHSAYAKVEGSGKAGGYAVRSVKK
jgi:uncharacterized protein (TIGR02145 family)